MAQVHTAIARNRRTEIAVETAFGTAPSGSWPEAFDALQLLHGDLVVDGLEQEVLEVLDQHIRRQGSYDGVLGLKKPSRWKAEMYLKALPAASQLTASGSAAQLSHRIVYKHMFGAEATVAAGSTTQSGSTTTSLVVGTGHGTRFVRGTWILVEVAGEMEPAFVAAISTDTLTIEPALSATPTTDGVVRNAYNYASANAKSQSLALRHSFTSALQFQLLGACFSGKFTFPEFGKLLTLSLDGMCVDWTAPGSLSYSTSVVTDDMGSPVPYLRTTLLLGDRSTLSRSSDLCPFKGLEIDLAQNNEMIEDGTASSQTVRGYVDTAGRTYPVTGMLRSSIDLAHYTTLSARTAQRLVQWVKYGTGTTASFLLWDVPRLFATKAPKPTKIGERLGVDFAWHALPDAGVSGGSSDHDLAPLRFALM